jgi:hypothetical protein
LAEERSQQENLKNNIQNMATKKKTTTRSSHRGAVIAGGLTALAVAAASAYLLSSKTQRKKLKRSALLAKDKIKRAGRQVATELKKFKSANKNTYTRAVNKVVAKYKQLKNVDPQEAKLLASELMAHWDTINKEINAAGKTVKKGIKKVRRRKRK